MTSKKMSLSKSRKYTCLAPALRHQKGVLGDLNTDMSLKSKIKTVKYDVCLDILFLRFYLHRVTAVMT